MAFASIYIPDFGLQAAFFAERTLRANAVALLDGTPPLLKIVAANDAALNLGVEIGMSQTQVEQISGVHFQQRSPAQEAAVHAVLLEVGRSFSPRLEDTAQEAIVIDLDGLFESQETIANHCAARMYEKGLSVNVAVATNVDTALHAAKGFSGITLIPPGEESLYLGPLPVSILTASPEVLGTLQSWGIHTFTALAALPGPELSERLGQEGIRLRQLAQGMSPRQLVIADLECPFEEELELEDPVVELEPLSFFLSRLIGQLSARLEARTMAFHTIRLRLELEPYSEKDPSITNDSLRLAGKPQTHETHLHLPAPTRDRQMLLNLLRLQLQADSPPGAVNKIVMLAEPANPKTMQIGLFLPSSPLPEKLELMVARLRKLVGDSNIGSPQLMDTHQPGAFRMRPFTHLRETHDKPSQPPATLSTIRREPRSNAPPIMAFRMFRPAVPARVELGDGRPIRVYFQGVYGDVIVVSGPWRTSGCWWTKDRWEQDEWDLEIRFRAPSGQTFAFPNRRVQIHRFYYDSIDQKWFVKGVYD